MKKFTKFNVVLEERVLDDFLEAFTYYNNISFALGNNFNSRFEFAMYKLSVSPFNYFNLPKRLRRITLGKFPYLMIYKIKDDTVTVIEFFHQASNPKNWRIK